MKLTIGYITVLDEVPGPRSLGPLFILTQYFLNRDIAAGLSQYLYETKGKDVTIIFDGYDEMSEGGRMNSFISYIIYHDVLPECGLIIASHPTASLCLHHMVDRRVEVLGFTKED